MNQQNDAAYLAAHNNVSSALRRGDIKAYSATHCPTRGRMLHVESDQGWDPEPVYQEFQEAPAFADAPN